jgi:chromosomal replication initiator protein
MMPSHTRTSTRPGTGFTTEPEHLVPARPAKLLPDPQLAARFEAALVARIGTQRYAMWFVGHTAVVPVGPDLVLAVSTESHQKWLEQTFAAAVRAAAAEASGGTAAVRFAVDAALFAEPKPAAAEVERDGPKPAPAGAAKPTRTLFGDEPPLPPPVRTRKPKAADPAPTAARNGRRWKSLADFVVGASNRVAHASALSVVDEPGDCANPLVIHGPVGTGKTHLLEGIYAGLRKAHPESRPTFLTAEEFTTRFVQACRFDKQPAFRRQVRDCSALLLDDLHFLATKPGSQKEFMQTLDALVADGKQVVVTTDCHPRLAEELMPELVDRLLGGAVWPVQPPDDATRLDILRKKATNSSPAISEAVLKYLARHLKGNVRELEGAVNSVRHFARVTGRPVDQPLAREALGDLLRHTVRAVTVREVDDAVCAVLGLGKGTLQSKARSWGVSHPRMLATYLARKHTAATYGEVAKHFGAKTHSTAVAAEKKVRGWLQKGEKLSLGDRKWDVKDLIDRIERELQR